MNKQTKIVTVIALILIAVGMAWYGLSQKQVQPAQQASEPIKIGQITCLTGENAWYGDIEKQGADLALEELNAKGGINGRQVVIVREDDKADPALSVTGLNKLISVDKVQAVMGMTSSGGTMAASPVAEKNKVVLISSLAGSMKISNAGDYIFRIFATTAQEAEKLLQLAKELGKTDAAIIYVNNDFGSDLASYIKEKSVKTGVNILASESYLTDATDFRTQLAKIAATKPSVIFLLGYPKDMGLVLKQAGEMGIKSQFMASDSFDDPTVIATAGKASEGTIYVVSDDQTSPAFKAAFKAKYGKDSSIYNAMNYDAFNLLALAIQRGGNDGTAIKNELYKIRDYAGVTGTITIDSNGDAINRPLAFKIIKDGKAVPYQQ